MANTLGEYIREAREGAGFTLRELGILLKMSHNQIHEWETGKRPVPRMHLPAIAEKLDLDAPNLRELWDADADERDAAALAKRGGR